MFLVYLVTMDSNINEIAKFIKEQNSKEEVESLLKELLSDSEIQTLSKRWCILSMLAAGRTQRDIVKELNVSLCKVTRGSKILKKKNSVIAKYFMEKFKNGNKHN